MKKSTKTVNLVLSAVMALSSFAAMSVTAGATENNISFGGEQEFDAVRITYKSGTAPADAKLSVNDQSYALKADETTQVVNVPEDTKASSITLTDYNAADVEVKLLAYDRIEMTKQDDSKPYTKPYLAKGWCGGDGVSDIAMNDISYGTRYKGLFDGDYDADGSMTAAKTGSFLYKPEITNSDGSKVRAENSWFALNFDFLQKTEIAKVRIIGFGSDNYLSGYTIGTISDTTNAKSPISSITQVTKDNILTLSKKKYSCMDNNGKTSEQDCREVDSIVNVETDKLQIKLDDFAAGTNATIYEMIFYTYKEVYTVGEKTYILNLENAPETFNAVRLSYSAPQSFSGTSQFIDADGNLIGEVQPVNFNGTVTGAAVLDTDTVASKTAAKVKITVPDGVGEPTVGEYLKYKRIPLLSDTELEDGKAVASYGKAYLDTSWQINDSIPKYNNRSDISHTRYKGLCDGRFDEKTGVIANLNAQNTLYFDSYERIALNFNFLVSVEIAKSTIIMKNGNNISGYKIGIPTYNETAKGYVDLNSPIISRSLSDIQKNTVKTFKGVNDSNVTAYELNDVVNTTSQIMQISFNERNVDKNIDLAEIAFYTYEAIVPEADPVPATAVNTFVQNLVGSDEDDSIIAGTKATAVWSVITPNDETVKKVTWTYGDKTGTYDSAEEGKTEISGKGSVYFGLILDWGTNEIPNAFKNLNKGDVIDKTVISTTLK